MSVDVVRLYRVQKEYDGSYRLHVRVVSEDKLLILTAAGWCLNERAARYTEVARLTEAYLKKCEDINSAPVAE